MNVWCIHGCVVHIRVCKILKHWTNSSYNDYGRLICSKKKCRDGVEGMFLLPPRFEGVQKSGVGL